MLRIAHIIAIFPPHVGGMGTVAYEECRRLASLGHEMTVFTLSYPGQHYDDSGVPFRIVRLKPMLRVGDAGWVPGLLGKLQGFDVVHLHYPWYGGAEWVWLAGLFHKQKYVVTYHMDAVPEGWFKKLIQAVYDIFLAKAILGGAAKVFAVSKENFAINRFGKYLSGEKMVELVNGVDTEIFRPQTVDPAEVGLGDWKDKKIILFVGNLLPVKGLDIVLQVFKQWQDEKSPLEGGLRGMLDQRLLIVGGGYEESRYRKMTTDYGLQTTVRFVGSCTDKKELARYYNVACCAVVPSLVESFSLVAVEALACGIVVVGSNILGIRERIESDGFLFTAGSVESLKEVLEKVLSLSTEERKVMGERGRKKVVEKYSLEKHMQKLEAAYRTL